MHEFIDAPASVLALRISSKIDGSDLDALMDRPENLLREHEKVHVFVETRSIEGIELSGLGRYTARTLPLLGKLRQFGRVAVVADQAWIRWGTRLESALLPFISYKVFEPEERDAAFAWVAGAEPSPA